MRDHFASIKTLARISHLSLQHSDLVLGIIYGEIEQVNANLKTLAQDYVIYAGVEFWHRFTGDQYFYRDLILAISDAAKEIDARQVIELTIQNLASEIKEKYTDMKFINT